MSLPVSKRVQRVKPSPTVALTGRVAQLKAEGKDIIGLGAGEPDFDTPTHIADAGVEAIRKGHTRYTAVEGTAELKDAIIAKFKRENGLDYARKQVLVSSGAKQTIFNLILAVIDPGDEAVIPAPYWVSYPDMVLLADGVPVTPYAGADQGYKITPAQLEAAITPKTRLFILNSPSNPTGAAYTRAELRALGEVLMKHPKIVICTDDMYEHIYWADEPFVSFANVCPELYDRVVTTNGVAKSYAMTGWRLGYAIWPGKLYDYARKLAVNLHSCVNAPTQFAGLAALTGPQDAAAQMVAEFDKRRAIVVEGLNRLPGVSCVMPKGAFYAFPNVKRTGWKAKPLAASLLEDSGVALIGGPDFGILGEGYVRVSYANSTENILKALDRMGEFLSSRKAA